MNTKIIAVTVAVLMVAGCAANPQTGQYEISKTAIGAVAGAATGAGIGALAGGKKKGKAALIGAAAGAVAGAGLGYYFDAQEQALNTALQGTGATVERQGSDLAVVMPGNIAFTSGSATLTTSAYTLLDSVVKVLTDPSITLTVAGYTDSVGSADTNLALSKSRASSVAAYLTQKGIAQSRIEVVGYGAANPIASNDTEQGRAQNRRVEIKLHSPQVQTQPQTPPAQ